MVLIAFYEQVEHINKNKNSSPVLESNILHVFLSSFLLKIPYICEVLREIFGLLPLEFPIAFLVNQDS